MPGFPLFKSKVMVSALATIDDPRATTANIASETASLRRLVSGDMIKLLCFDAKTTTCEEEVTSRTKSTLLVNCRWIGRRSTAGKAGVKPLQLLVRSFTLLGECE